MASRVGEFTVQDTNLTHVLRTPGQGRPHAVSRPPTTDLALLAIAVLAISTTGPLIALCAAPALAIAFWRCSIGAAVMTPLAGRELTAIRGLDRRGWLLMLLAGGLLALHFATWIPSLRFTTVASSTALVATQPVWAALIARARGHQVPGRAWLGIAIALSGVVLLGGFDFALNPRALIGDALALAGAITAAFYVTVGAHVRASVPTSVYTSVCYASAAVALLGLCLATGTAVWGFDARDWWLIAAVTFTGQILGHTLMNRVLATTSATVVSMAILFEMPGSTLLAAWWVGQVPPIQIWPAVALLLAGIVVVIRSGRR
jgi:drug/metabolite transporter (DMT)-like permease